MSIRDADRQRFPAVLIDNGGGCSSYAFENANARLEGSGFNVEPATESAWRPMPSAPRDRSYVIVWDNTRKRSMSPEPHS